jgi:hypothetical protein
MGYLHDGTGEHYFPRAEEDSYAKKPDAAKSAMKTQLPDYTEADISDEAWREVVYPDRVYRIDSPVKLIFRKGGSTHRVVDANGVVHCYAAPESGRTTLRWKAKDGLAPVRF